ncbi:MAG: single-stranded DNA-binding protein [cyanobacterium endosymbiont of Rhopalodia musculus]|uniref:single-stranded DNA-binding protein n=1 Tax=cyanobacterium endosymbiont of Epithemia clementina EcSB TaxID=3034674 RepID=UPI0024818829|nr:single-stranded DNA-binding protein [cyanobacterium endosymbiont of Epithemia clementina EcSB]WGT66756.1 single-stranded DNA-binding protein [cyanobacterium endosymbiont of Epithemia clementina EcSB]
MNSCVLMIKVIRPPELRFTQDNKTPIAQMLVEFAGRRSETSNSTIKVIGWGSLATQMQDTYKEGDRLIIEGRLSMNTFDRPEGFKEKRVELVASHVHPLDSYPTSPIPFTSEDNVVSEDAYQSSAYPESDQPVSTPTYGEEDPIPF